MTIMRSVLEGVGFILTAALLLGFFLLVGVAIGAVVWP